jgi:TonB family protein
VRVAAAALLAGCGRSGPAREPAAVEVEVWGDTSRSMALRVEPPRADRVWVRTVAIARSAPLDAPLPDAPPVFPPPDSFAPPGLDVDPGLKSPILREPARLLLPPARGRAPGGRAEAVELDVRVSDAGEVTDARWAGGSADTALVAAAIACARTMRFHPALLAGKPVTVWARQRFEFPAR